MRFVPVFTCVCVLLFFLSVFGDILGGFGVRLGACFRLNLVVPLMVRLLFSGFVPSGARMHHFVVSNVGFANHPNRPPAPLVHPTPLHPTKQRDEVG